MTQTQFESIKVKCDNNDGAACARLYYFYISSKHSFLSGLKVDKKRALHYAQKGCHLEDEDGCFTAGMTLYYGDKIAGILPDREQGRKYLKRSCELGKEDVCTFFLNKNF